MGPKPNVRGMPVNGLIQPLRSAHEPRPRRESPLNEFPSLTIVPTSIFEWTDRNPDRRLQGFQAVK